MREHLGALSTSLGTDWCHTLYLMASEHGALQLEQAECPDLIGHCFSPNVCIDTTVRRLWETVYKDEDPSRKKHTKGLN